MAAGIKIDSKATIEMLKKVAKQMPFANYEVNITINADKWKIWRKKTSSLFKTPMLSLHIVLKEKAKRYLPSKSLSLWRNLSQ